MVVCYTVCKYQRGLSEAPIGHAFQIILGYLRHDSQFASSALICSKHVKATKFLENFTAHKCLFGCN